MERVLGCYVLPPLPCVQKADCAGHLLRVWANFCFKAEGEHDGARVVMKEMTHMELEEYQSLKPYGAWDLLTGLYMRVNSYQSAQDLAEL